MLKSYAESLVIGKKSTDLTGDINNDGKINNLDIIKTPLNGNGDFRSPECIELLKEVDIVVRNDEGDDIKEIVKEILECLEERKMILKKL